MYVFPKLFCFRCRLQSSQVSDDEGVCIFLYSYMNSLFSIPLHPQVVDLVWDLCHNFWRMTTLPVSPDLRNSFRSEGSTLLVFM